MGSATENRKIHIYINGKQIENNMKSIRVAYRKANNALNKMTIGTQEYINKTLEIKQLKGVMDQHRNGVFGAQKAWASLKGVMFSVLGANLIQSGFQKMLQFIPDLINRAAGLSDVMADVMKTSGLTKLEVNKLNKEFRSFDTRTPRKELLALAVEGGRLGKDTVKDLADFVKVADQIKVALGDDLGGNGAEAIRMVGKLTTQYKIGNQYQTEFGESMLKLGSGINAVSASGSNQAAFQIDYMKRLSGIAHQADLTAASIIGYGAASDEAGLNLEVSATTTSKVMVDMFKDSAEYAEIAGIKHSEFAQLLKTDSNEAFLLFLKGLNGNNEGLGIMADKMEGLGLEGSRAITVLSSMAANTDNIRIKQELANKAMEEGTSLTAEFNVKNDNLAGQWEKIGKYMSKIWTNSAMMTGMENMVGWMYSLIEVPLVEKMEKERISMRALELQIYDTNIPHSKRVELINELKKQHPKYLGMIDAETISNNGLQMAMKQVNDKMINRIILQGKSEKIEGKAKEVAEAIEKQLDLETLAREKLVKTSEKWNIPLKTNLTLSEQLAHMSKVFLNTWEKTGSTKVNLLNLGLGFQGTSSGIQMASKSAEKLRGELDLLTKDRSAFENLNNSKKPIFDYHHNAEWKARQKKEEEVVVVGDELSDKEKSNLKKKYEDFAEKQKAMRKRMGFGEFDDSEKNETEISGIIADDTPDPYTKMWGDDPLFEQEMDKVYEHEMAKAQLIKEIEEASRNELYTSKEAESLINHLALLERAEQEGLDVTELKKQIREDEAALEHAELMKRVANFETYYNEIKGVANAYFGWQAAKQEAILTDSQRRAEAEILTAQNKVKGDVFTQEQADIQIAQIKERARKREAKIKLEQWRTQRAADLIEVGIQTALAVIKAAPNPLLMASAGATGLLSGLTISAAKEPAFAFGTNNAPGGSSWVGEFGPERVNLPKGAEVISATESVDLLSDERNAQMNIGPGGVLGGNSEVLAELRAMKNLLANFPHLVTGDWRLDDLDAARKRKEQSEKAGAM